MISRLSFHIEFRTHRVYITENDWVFFLIERVDTCTCMLSDQLIIRTVKDIVSPSKTTFFQHINICFKINCKTQI